jgi:signal transduction histidine kinase
LRDFSRPGDSEWQAVDLHAGLESTLNVVWNEIKFKADVVREYAELPPVECLPSQLNQVFLNLLVNAAQAIPERGTITLRTTCEGDWVSVAVADTGGGMTPEVRARVFDPFFTTKPVGKGTGLGLSVTYGIIEKHGGHIDVDSEPGKGSTFTVRLPLTRAKATT